MLVCFKCIRVGRDVELIGIGEVALCYDCAAKLHSLLTEHMARIDAETETCND